MFGADILYIETKLRCPHSGRPHPGYPEKLGWHP